MAFVAIEQVVEGENTTHTITWDWTHPVATRNAAIAGAKQQAIDWIDSQSPPPVIEEDAVLLVPAVLSL